MTATDTRDRYVSFEGLECDANATRLVETLRRHITSAPDTPWANYFQGKFEEKERLGVDDLFFIGSQMNNIYDFFAELGDTAAEQLLYQVEQECC